MDINKYSKGFANPFMLSSVIVIVLNIMVFFFFHPKVSRKTYFRGIFYMFIVTMSMVYLHHRAVDEEYRLELEKNMNIKLINQTGSDEIEPVIDVFKTETTGGGEDELI